MRRFLVGTLLILSLTGVAIAAQADHCKRWNECIHEDMTITGS